MRPQICVRVQRVYSEVNTPTNAVQNLLFCRRIHFLDLGTNRAQLYTTSFWLKDALPVTCVVLQGVIVSLVSKEGKTIETKLFARNVPIFTFKTYNFYTVDNGLRLSLDLLLRFTGAALSSVK